VNCSRVGWFADRPVDPPHQAHEQNGTEAENEGGTQPGAHGKQLGVPVGDPTAIQQEHHELVPVLGAHHYAHDRCNRGHQASRQCRTVQVNPAWLLASRTPFPLNCHRSHCVTCGLASTKHGLPQAARAPATSLLWRDDRLPLRPLVSLPRAQLPPVPRAIATAATEALGAVWSEDPVAFQRAARSLATLDRDQVGLVLGAVVRSLLEDLHPGGLTGEDMHDLLARCVATRADLLPAVDADVLLVLLAGSLGIHAEEDDRRQVTAIEMSTHAPLLIATLLGRSPRGEFTAHLDAAFTEIARSETVEMP